MLLLTFEGDAKVRTRLGVKLHTPTVLQQAKELCDMVDGTLVSPVQLQDLADLAAIRKVRLETEDLRGTAIVGCCV